MATRYGKTPIAVNVSKKYEELFKERNVPFIRQYLTPKMDHLTAAEISTLNVVSHAWKLGDRYYKLAYYYYGIPSYWWIIAWFNRSPTESHLEIGEVISIPLPLTKVLDYLDL